MVIFRKTGFSKKIVLKIYLKMKKKINFVRNKKFSLKLLIFIKLFI